MQIVGNSSSREVIQNVSELCINNTVMIIHDGGHTKDQVLKDMYAYSDLVSINSYFIVEDGIVDLFDHGDGLGAPYYGPLTAIEEFLNNNKSFAVDSMRERYILTYNPKGFLKRTR